MHLVWYTPAPLLAVPEPGGKPAPFGPMLMSHFAMSCGDTGTPRCGPCCAATAPAAPMPISSAATATGLHVDIADLSRRRYVPALNRVVVIAIARAARGHQRRSRRLHVAELVDGTAHQHARRTAPLPRQPKAHERLRQHGL